MVRMNMGAELRQVDRGFSIIASNTKYRDLPVIIGECDPEGCAACGMTVYPQNGYRNGTMYSSYTASSFARIYDLARDYKINLLGIVSWSFEFEDQPWFHGFRDLATNGVDKPVLNVFRMFGMMGTTRVESVSGQEYTYKSIIDSGVKGNKTDIGALASKGVNYSAVIFWNYHDDDRISPDADIVFNISGIPAKRITVTQYRIDRDHSNSYEAWKRMGSPQDPSPEQYSKLEKSGMLEVFGKSYSQKVKNSAAQISTTIQRQGVGLLKIEWK
jgi:xylan 1,4-beta-xylosidase